MQTNNLLLDTHVWLWLMNGDATLSKKTQALIDAAHQAGGLWISAISTWEISMLEAKKRIILSMPCLEWIQASLHKGIQVLELSPAIAVDSCHLPEYPAGDPADRIIIATARHHTLTLLTRDEHILAYGQQKWVSVQAI